MNRSQIPIRALQKQRGNKLTIQPVGESTIQEEINTMKLIFLSLVKSFGNQLTFGGKILQEHSVLPFLMGERRKQRREETQKVNLCPGARSHNIEATKQEWEELAHTHTHTHTTR